MVVLLEHQLQLQMGWGVPWRAASRAKAVVAAFSVSGISEYGNKKDVDSLQVISTQLEVSGEVILGYLLFSRLAVMSTAPERTSVGTRVLSPFDKLCGVRTRVLAAFDKVCRVSEQDHVPVVQERYTCVEVLGKGHMVIYGL